MFDDIVDLINDEKFDYNNIKDRKKLLNLINDYIEEETWDKSIKNMINYFKDNNIDNNMIKIVLSNWHNQGDLDAIFIILIKYYLISKENLNFLFNKLNLSDLKTILEKSIEVNDNQNYHFLATNLISFYKEDLDGDDYINLISYTREFQSKTLIDCNNIIDFFTFKKSQVIYADVPDWVSIKEGENLSLLTTVNPGKNYEDIEDDVDKLVKKAKDIFHTTPFKKDEDLEEIGISKEFEEALINYLSASSLDTNHFANRVFGPANRFVDKNCISNNNKNGPCRMLECLCREIDSDRSMIMKEWFRGVCENYDCSKRIRDRSHCVRIPIEFGGWKGCYCSFDCMNNSLSFRDKDMNFRIEYMKASLNEDGIMDRTQT